MGLFEKLQRGLAKTKAGFVERLGGVFSRSKIDESMFDELEEVLIQADVGVETAEFLLGRLRQKVKEEKITDPSVLELALREEILSLLQVYSGGLQFKEGLNILLLVGVNGAGKTTSIGKLSVKFAMQGKKVLLAAADTFRAAAAEQLKIWGDRAGVEVISQGMGADPGAVVYDAVRAAISRKTDILIIDTAGRLQTKSNLMEELKKIVRIIKREAPEADTQTLLVLDAGTGQNAISQAKLFSEAAEVSGIILTKLDGTSKGGVVIGICRESGLPVKMIGVGESREDLYDFSAEDFALALFDRK